MLRRESQNRDRRPVAAGRAALVVVCIALLAAAPAIGQGPGGRRHAPARNDVPAQGRTGGLSRAQRADLWGIARATWRFFGADVDPGTQLPLDNLGPGATRGRYTSAANVGVYLWSVVAARDLGLISTARAERLARATMREVATLERYRGFLYQWYDTDNGRVLLNPGQGDCPKTGGTQDNCSFVSAVDNGWYATGLIEVRNALPRLRGLASALLEPMDFSIFYDNRAQTPCNTNASLPGNPPTGQQYGGYYAGVGPAGYHNGALYSDPRISMYVGMGRHQMPGDVWWRTWRTLPPKRCPTDPDFSWQGQWPTPGFWEDIRDPQSGRVFPVWEGHYVDPGTGASFIPTFAGGMFEGLMANLVVPETVWGPHSFGLADVRLARIQAYYDTRVLHLPVWGMSPSSTPDDTGGYSGYGVAGMAYPPGQRLSQCGSGCGGAAQETAVSPHASIIALPVAPEAAYENIVALRGRYPDLYNRDGGFYDAVDPRTGAVGHRRLVLDQSMIMAALADVLAHDSLQSHFAHDPIAWAARTYLSAENMGIG